MTIDEFVSRLQKVKATGQNSYTALCPSHKDSTPSLSVQLKHDGIAVKCFAGCSTNDICMSLGLQPRDLFFDSKKNGHSKNEKVEVARYDYVDELGSLLYQKIRYVPKTFRQRRPNPKKKGDWIWDAGPRKVLYRLPKIIEAVRNEVPIFFVEGEKDVETLEKAGFVATTTSDGAESEWQDSYNFFLEGADVTIIQDRDDPGRKFGARILDAIATVARSSRRTEMSDRNGKKVKDVSDWFGASSLPIPDQAPEFDEYIQSAPAGDPTEQVWTLKELLTYNIESDKNAVIGMHDGKTTRYLCKGAGAWIIGQSGLGKSSLTVQQGFTWAMGRPFMGIIPTGPKRVLIVQSENDEGDTAEATQGVIRGVAKTDEELVALCQNVRIIRCRGRTGSSFCSWLQEQIDKFRADIVYVDPLIRFAGVDVSRQDQCTRFLNDMLDPVLASTGVVLIGAHHTGKPKSYQETKGWTIYDMAYSGIGSSELVNWARAISILRVLSEENQTFELLLSKRGPRAWATHPNGDPTTTIFLKHAAEGIFWEQINPEDLPETQKRTSSTKEGRPSKLTQIASENLFVFCNGCLPQGEGLREIARRLERYFASQKIDVSVNTCIRAIPLLVANGKLTKTPESTYVKGPNA